LADLDEQAMIHRISQLRPNAPFLAVVPKSPDGGARLIGSVNLHLQVNFEDGVQWLIRISMYGTHDGPVDLLRNNLESEALTYKLLYKHGIPVPVVHHWGTGEFSKTNSESYEVIVANQVDPLCRHIVYDKMPGIGAEETEVALSEGNISRQEMKVFTDEFAAMSIKLSKIPSDAIGSLTKTGAGDIFWGPHLNGGYQESLEAPYFGGPFSTLRDRYVHRIDGLVGLTKQGLIYRKSPLLHYLALMEARRLVIADPVMSQQEPAFYIRHPDCSGANILANGLKIVGLIDWEW
jgi:hypothetical protein